MVQVRSHATPRPDLPRTAKAKPVELRVAAHTHVGLIRAHNEDTFFVADLTNGKRDAASIRRAGLAGIALGVCDGMGGAAAGEVASRIAAETIVERMAKVLVSMNMDEFAATLLKTIEAAGAAIRRDARSHPSRKGMGTTCTAAALRGDTLFVGQVGDSRAYIFRGGVLTQITKDQSLLNQMLELKQLTPAQAAEFNGSNVILQALGTTEKLAVELTSLQLLRGDRLLICSDGLHGLVSDACIADVLAHRGLDDAGARLIELANDAGGRDNTTVVLADFDGPGLQAFDPGLVVGYQPYTPSAAALAVASDAQPVSAALQPPDASDPITLPFILGVRHAIGAGLVGVALLLLLVLWHWEPTEPQTRGESAASALTSKTTHAQPTPVQPLSPREAIPVQPADAQQEATLPPVEGALESKPPRAAKRPPAAVPVPPRAQTHVVVIPAESDEEPPIRKWDDKGESADSPFQ